MTSYTSKQGTFYRVHLNSYGNSYQVSTEHWIWFTGSLEACRAYLLALANTDH